MKQFEYWFDEEREMIYFSNGYQSLVANGGYFFWPVEGKSVFFHEDMVELEKKTGYIFKQIDKPYYFSMTWIRHDFERSMSKRLNEEVKLKVDNSGFVRMLNWFKKNTDLLEPHNSGTVSPDSGVKHADKTEALKKAGLDTSFPYGYCYPISQFVFYTLGGYDSDYDLKLIKEIKFEFKGKRGQTTHWFVQHKTSGRIIDLTIEQFDRIPDVNIEELFPNSRRANLGFPYYRTKNGKVEFDHTPPCLQTLKLYDRYREDVEKIPGLEKYWSACNYATERRKGDENKPLDEMYDSRELYSLDEIVRRYWS